MLRCVARTVYLLGLLICPLAVLAAPTTPAADHGDGPPFVGELVTIAPADQPDDAGALSSGSTFITAPECDIELLPYAPGGYSFPVVPSSIQHTGTADSFLFTGKPTYFDWWMANTGTAPALGTFYVDVWLDGLRFIHEPFTNHPNGYYSGGEDWAFIINGTGWHTLAINVDPDNTISECNESNNYWEQDFYWEPVDGWWGEYFNNMNLAGDPVLVRDEFIDFQWPGSPGPGVNEDGFSVRWARNMTLNTETYHFTLTRDNGMRFYFDEVLVYDEWTDTVDQDVFIFDIVPGQHTLRVEMFESAGTATAMFERRPCYQVTKSSVPTGSGSVGVSPAPDCNAKYIGGQDVTLTASPAAGYTFSHWSGDVSGSTNPLTVSLQMSHNVVANFTQTCYTLTTAVSPSGSGTVSATPGANCAGGKYTPGTVVSLTANAGGGYTFDHWSGDISGAANPRNVTMNANRSVTAHFTLAQTYTLTASANPAPGGVVTLNPDKAGYQAGEQVQVTATANSGYHFANWSGSLGGSTNPTTVTMNGNKTIVANFTQECYSLGLAVNPPGVGVVNPSPPPNCSSQYAAGTVVSLTAVGSAGWGFANWSGDLSGTQNPKSLTMNGQRSVTAQFQEVTVQCYALTLDHTGQGTDPQGAPPQSAGCAAGSYTAGATVQLTADPANGWRVAGWRGTANNGATTLTNSLVMPVAAHTAWVDYATEPTGQQVTLPMVLFGAPYGYLGPFEQEDNDQSVNATGPLLLNRDYFGFPNDERDWFEFNLATTTTLFITLDNMSGTDPQLTLYYEADFLEYDPTPPYSLIRTVVPGHYYVRVLVGGDFNTTTQYKLRISAP